MNSIRLASSARALLRQSNNATRSIRTFKTASLSRLRAGDVRNIQQTAPTPIQQTKPAQEGEYPYSQTEEEVRHDYIPGKIRKHGVGHSTTGPGVGRHNNRTLASFSLEGKICIVSGANRGLGNLFARTMVECGASQIAVVDLDAGQAKEAARDIEKWFVEHGEAEEGEIEAIGIGCDVSKEDQITKAMDEIIEKFGRVDVLVTAAGIVENIPAVDYPIERARKLWSINVDGSFMWAQQVARDMIRRGEGGSIILIGSMSANIVNVPQPQAPYNASKAAIKHMASSLAVEWAKHNIRVNCLSPGYMLTALTRAILDKDPELKRTWEQLTPMGRMGEPEDLKGALAFLASDSSAFVTGTQINVDGGYICT